MKSGIGTANEVFSQFWIPSVLAPAFCFSEESCCAFRSDTGVRVRVIAGVGEGGFWVEFFIVGSLFFLCLEGGSVKSKLSLIYFEMRPKM